AVDRDDGRQPLHRRPDRGRGIVGWRDGGGGSMNKSDAQTLAGARETRPTWPAPLPPSDDARPLYDRIQDVIALYPERKSAVVQALRLAQDEYGWLSEQAFDEVADATGFTPAFCKSVASFY